MPSLASVPPEILAEILGWLSSDVGSLKNCSFSCSALLPVSQYYLLAVVDFSFLGDMETEPLRDCITELQVTPNSEPLASDPETYINTALSLPRLNTIRFNWGTSPLQPAFATAVQQRLHEFTSVTHLVLRGMVYSNIDELRNLICSLPSLTHLTVGGLLFRDRRPSAGNYFMRHRKLPDHPDGPRLTYISVAPGYNAEATTAILEWLPCTPTRDSMRTVEIPEESRNTIFVVDCFGPSVYHLSIAKLESIASWKMGFISRYTALRSLELGAMSPASWQQLYKMVAEIRSPHFVELVLRYDAVADPDAAIAPNTVETSPVDYALRVKLPSVKRVCFVVVYDPQVTGSGGDTVWRDGVVTRVRACFRRLAEGGKLQIEFEHAKINNQKLRQEQTVFRTSRNRTIGP
ncbi:hypothetical protein GSI_09434 [Ganoderma sinense ZZ0214-1]|uniref:F-box domain-containing protein n=1 Tax=Ganoderma sinense ZZ0214-1 TaxID=1077348 RepID=A0A2G8S6I0_9APHY|nr:hypothetical protein GSI_09434 [Ganoderma sinense ZZ0214-1]